MDSWQTEKRFLHASGHVVWTIANLTFLRGEAGRPLSWLGQFQDITERKRREERLGHMAISAEALLATADRAMYAAKAAGRDCVRSAVAPPTSISD